MKQTATATAEGKAWRRRAKGMLATLMVKGLDGRDY
jgi:hypothetical protein